MELEEYLKMLEKISEEKTQHEKILIIDDEKRIRDGCHTILKQEGYTVACAKNGEQGLNMIANEHFDIVLVDLMMPKLSGFDVLTQVKARHPDTVVIVITGYATIEHSIEAMKKGAFDFIPKPFSPDQLRVVVSKAIEYNRALQDIANEKSRMRIMINRLSGGVLTTDNQKRVVLANPAFLDMVGCREKSVIGRLIENIVDNPKLIALINKALSMPLTDFVELNDELTSKQENSTDEIILGAHCIPFRDRAGINLGTITILHDITALKRKDQIKSDFVSLVAHEIRGPMTSVLMQLKVLMDGLAGDLTDKQNHILDRVSQKTSSLIHLTTELLDLSKIESGLISQEKEQISMAEIIQEQIQFHQAKAKAKNLSLTAEAMSAVPPVLANQNNMEEVLSNLITNAVNYTPVGGSISISLETDDDFLCVGISDNGYGIPPEELDRIFDRFYRVKNEQTRYIIGTGLGLSIVKSIVEAHHGRIRVESAMDKGSTFYIYIPLQPF